MSRLRIFFTPSVGSRVRNVIRAGIALGAAFGLKLSAEQTATILVFVEVVFTAGGEVTRRV